jgi:hypothetical protein
LGCFKIRTYTFLFKTISGFVSCRTHGGPDPNAKCKFPFTLWGIEYYECTYIGNYDKNGEMEEEPWCSTKNDAWGNHVGVNRLSGIRMGEQKWGYCGQSCPLPGK